MTEVLDPEEQAALAEQWGGEPFRSLKPGTETVKELVRGVEQTVRNPNPTWVLTYPNGRRLEVRGERDANGVETGNLVPTGGLVDALKPLTTRTPAAGEIWVRQADGSQVRMRTDPETGRKIPVLDENGDLIIQEPVRRAGGRGSTETPSLRAQRETQAALNEAKLAGRLPPQPLAPETAALREAQTLKAEADAAKVYRGMVPKALQVLRDLGTTVDEISRQYEAGTITAEEMNAYYDEANSAATWALRGTTPDAQEKARQQQITTRAQMGKDLLNQRLQSGTSLANSMMSDYRQILTRAPLGPDFDYERLKRANPLSLSLMMTRYLGGGDEISELGKELLRAARPEAQTPIPSLGRGLPTPDLLIPAGRVPSPSGLVSPLISVAPEGEEDMENGEEDEEF